MNYDWKSNVGKLIKVEFLDDIKVTKIFRDVISRNKFSFHVQLQNLVPNEVFLKHFCDILCDTKASAFKLFALFFI